ncbi:hypothetical protein BaRGS_00023864 [Batillaria attramentaria]|uniref:Uncharacterized protein n=1 Tax=Batillaria attramentaria TaxID=370345 RepID=A0ABD0KCT2_9CAEN
MYLPLSLRAVVAPHQFVPEHPQTGEFSVVGRCQCSVCAYTRTECAFSSLSNTRGFSPSDSHFALDELSRSTLSARAKRSSIGKRRHIRDQPSSSVTVTQPYHYQLVSATRNDRVVTRFTDKHCPLPSLRHGVPVVTANDSGDNQMDGRCIAGACYVQVLVL